MSRWVVVSQILKQLLQSVTKKYFKVGQLLQIVTIVPMFMFM